MLLSSPFLPLNIFFLVLLPDDRNDPKNSFAVIYSTMNLSSSPLLSVLSY